MKLAKRTELEENRIKASINTNEEVIKKKKYEQEKFNKVGWVYQLSTQEIKLAFNTAIKSGCIRYGYKGGYCEPAYTDYVIICINGYYFEIRCFPQDDYYSLDDITKDKFNNHKQQMIEKYNEYKKQFDALEKNYGEK